jgi:hypothetical protein
MPPPTEKSQYLGRDLSNATRLLTGQDIDGISRATKAMKRMNLLLEGLSTVTSRCDRRQED